VEIKIPLIDYKDAKVISGLEDLVILHPDHLEYKWKCTLDLSGEDHIGITSQKGRKVILKEYIFGAEAYWSISHERYVATLDTNFSPCWVFATMKEAETFQDKILTWLKA